ncbi:MAG: CsgG/HfaB family protein [Armatimonadota bacterium]
MRICTTIAIALIFALLACIVVLADAEKTAIEASAGEQPPVQKVPAQRLAVLKLRVDGPHASQIRQWLPELIETRLAEDGWTVLARGETMREIRKEQELAGVDPTTAPEKDKVWGASALLDLTARITIKETNAGVNIGLFSIGGYVEVKVELSGQAVDTTTGVEIPLGIFKGQESKLRTLAVVLPTKSYIGGGFSISAVKESMVGKAADKAAMSLVEKLNEMPGLVPGREQQISDAPDAIYLNFAEDALPRVGDEYGIFRGDVMIARVKITRLEGSRARCELLAQIDEIQGTDVARPLAIEIPVEVQTAPAQ